MKANTLIRVISAIAILGGIFQPVTWAAQSVASEKKHEVMPAYDIQSETALLGVVDQKNAAQGLRNKNGQELPKEERDLVKEIFIRS